VSDNPAQEGQKKPDAKQAEGKPPKPDGEQKQTIVEALAASDPPPTAALDPSKVVEWSGADGKKRRLAIRELMESAEVAEAAPVWISDKSAVEKYTLMDQALQGDAGAASKLLEKYPEVMGAGKQPAQPTVEHVPVDQFMALQDKLNAMEQQLQQMAGTVGDVESARTKQSYQYMIQAHKDKLPYLAAHPKAADLAINKLNELRQQGVDFSQVQQPGAAIGMILQTVENELAATVQLYGGAVPPGQAPAPGGTQTVVMDDQQAAGQGRKRSVLDLSGFGKTTDAAGVPLAQPPLQPAGTIPNQPVESVPAGSGAVGGIQQQPADLKTREGGLARMRERLAQLRAAEGV